MISSSEKVSSSQGCAYLRCLSRINALMEWEPQLGEFHGGILISVFTPLVTRLRWIRLAGTTLAGVKVYGVSGVTLIGDALVCSTIRLR